MTIQDLLKHEYICKISPDFKSEPDYTDNEFSLIIKEDKSYDSGYIGTITGVNSDGEKVTNFFDGETTAKNIIYGNWIIINKYHL